MSPLYLVRPDVHHRPSSTIDISHGEHARVLRPLIDNNRLMSLYRQFSLRPIRRPRSHHVTLHPPYPHHCSRAAFATFIPPAMTSIKASPSPSCPNTTISNDPPTTLCDYALRVLTTPDPARKAVLTHEAAKAYKQHRVIGHPHTPPETPARPPLPKIIPAGKMPSVKASGYPANIYYLHSLAHVELNAIDLCMDTMLRFPPLPDEIAPAAAKRDIRRDSHTENDDDRNDTTFTSWFDDWLSIAVDEARHYTWLSERLTSLKAPYGTLPAHNIIWHGANNTRDTRRTRLAIGQLVSEARGLDAGPRLASRLLGTGDKKSAGIVSTIADEELRHVQLGVKWFIWECERCSVDAVKTFHDIAVRLGNPGAFTRPFNAERRRRAGLTEDWYEPVAEMMEQMRAERRLREKGEGEKGGGTVLVD